MPGEASNELYYIAERLHLTRNFAHDLATVICVCPHAQGSDIFTGNLLLERSEHGN